MARRRIGLAVAVALLGALAVALPVRAACALAPPRVSLTGFTLSEGPRPFYLGWEAQQTKVTIAFTGGCGSSMSVDFATRPGTAAAGEDYTHTSGTASAPVPGDDPVLVDRSIPIIGDSQLEPVVQSATFELSNPQAPGQGTPSLVDSWAAILIVDSDGSSRIAFEGVPSSQSETFATARIAVFRAGPVAAPTSISYTVAPGPGTPATPGADFTVTSPGVLDFQAGERFETIDLAVVNDKIGEGPEDVTITLSGTEVVEPSSTIFTIVDNEESVAPTSRFHHPRHTWRYKKSDYRIREFHVFATDNPGGAGVVAAEIALRRNLKNGACAWLTLSGWQKKDCQNREWLPTRYDDVGELFYYRMKQLKSSVGTRIKDYTAFSRAIDGAENVEKEFTQRRNANTFEIKRAKRRR